MEMRPVDSTQAKNYMIKAENSLRMAKIAFEQGAHDNAVMSSVHAAINSLDALTTLYLGKRSSGSHSDVIGMIRPILTGKEHTDVSRQFSSLMSLKNASEYQPNLMSHEDAQMSVLQAERIIARVKSKFDLKK